MRLGKAKPATPLPPLGVVVIHLVVLLSLACKWTCLLLWSLLPDPMLWFSGFSLFLLLFSSYLYASALKFQERILQVCLVFLICDFMDCDFQYYDYRTRKYEVKEGRTFLFVFFFSCHGEGLAWTVFHVGVKMVLWITTWWMCYSVCRWVVASRGLRWWVAETAWETERQRGGQSRCCLSPYFILMTDQFRFQNMYRTCKKKSSFVPTEYLPSE